MQKLEVRLRQIPVPELPVEERIRTFNEVALGYTEEQALAESSRCLQCNHPLCVELCPIHVNIPKFIRLIRLGAYEEAYKVIRERNTLPSICGRVCPTGDAVRYGM
jgi:glutamate synthase (NADPH/NADH) small chain